MSRPTSLVYPTLPFPAGLTQQAIITTSLIRKIFGSAIFSDKEICYRDSAFFLFPSKKIQSLFTIGKLTFFNSMK